MAECSACGLCKTRTQTVFADGTGRVRVLFVGEAPGENEDLQGVPFVGRAGALLTDIITKGMGLARQDVTIANVLKCRPPDNRDPSPAEKLLCTAWLDRQIELVDPQVIIPLGRHAACHILETEASMGSLRGRVHERGGAQDRAHLPPGLPPAQPGHEVQVLGGHQAGHGRAGLAHPLQVGAEARGNRLPRPGYRPPVPALRWPVRSFDPPRAPAILPGSRPGWTQVQGLRNVPGDAPFHI